MVVLLFRRCWSDNKCLCVCVCVVQVGRTQEQTHHELREAEPWPPLLLWQEHNQESSQSALCLPVCLWPGVPTGPVFQWATEGTQCQWWSSYGHHHWAKAECNQEKCVVTTNACKSHASPSFPLSPASSLNLLLFSVLYNTHLCSRNISKPFIRFLFLKNPTPPIWASLCFWFPFSRTIITDKQHLSYHFCYILFVCTHFVFFFPEIMFDWNFTATSLLFLLTKLFVSCRQSFAVCLSNQFFFTVAIHTHTLNECAGQVFLL